MSDQAENNNTSNLPRTTDKLDNEQLAGYYTIDTRKAVVNIITRDLAFGNDLAKQIGHFGYQVQLVGDERPPENTANLQRVQAILVDLDSAKDETLGTEFINSLEQWRHLSIPMMFISSKDDQEARLQAVRAGGKAFLHKPVDIVRLVDLLDEYDPAVPSEPDQVLIIESQPTIGNYYQMVLKRAGISSIVVNDATQALKAIMEFNPDLILLDLQMPKISGSELTMIIRQMDSHISIPIVFISSEDDIRKQTEVMSLGGDDFLAKPVKGAQLISVVKNRLSRSIALREFMIHDSLTGLLNHTTYREYLKQEINRSERQNTGLAMAMIDLDHFKKVNDTYGHSVGDSVLKSLARLLKQSLRKSDIIGRHGGEEFVAILLDAQEAQAYSVMEHIRINFSQIRHFTPRSGEFTVTFSCGIATYPRFNNYSLLSDAADRALYAAKAVGRNCTMVARE